MCGRNLLNKLYDWLAYIITKRKPKSLSISFVSFVWNKHTLDYTNKMHVCVKYEV